MLVSVVFLKNYLTKLFLKYCFFSTQGLKITFLICFCISDLVIVEYSRPSYARMDKTNYLVTAFKSSLDIEQIHSIAQSITVKVIADIPIGSGIIIDSQGLIYTVLTNAHVLSSGETPYSIQTSNGETYLAEVSTEFSAMNKDVALLTFRSTKIYNVTTIGSISGVEVGDKVFTSGFRYATEASVQENNFTFREGQVALILEHPLRDGYRIGYTNQVDIGMSGGPLLNSQGEVIGINGLRDNPLWNDPLQYDDGTDPNPLIQELLSQLSLAIPLEDILDSFDR